MRDDGKVQSQTGRRSHEWCRRERVPEELSVGRVDELPNFKGRAVLLTDCMSLLKSLLGTAYRCHKVLDNLVRAIPVVV